MIFNCADILIPHQSLLDKWCVVACDQYTSQPRYWELEQRRVSDSPSSLHVTLPEVYLESPDVDEKISNIHKNMQEYLAKDIFREFPSSLIYVKRTLSSGGVRNGLVGAIDLQEYDYGIGSKSPVRATENTVLERIPPRAKVRLNAPLELPHVMLLMEDPSLEIFSYVDSLTKSQVYSTTLPFDSGSVEGYLLEGDNMQAVLQMLHEYSKKSSMPFAVGDGNHSLATAKNCWEQKRDNLPPNHPARFALVELVNIHDTSLDFEPIHRTLFNCNRDHLLETLQSSLGQGEMKFDCTYDGALHQLSVGGSSNSLEVEVLQRFLDNYISLNPHVKIDYVHGADTATQLATKHDCISFLLPFPDKSKLFSSVVLSGALPRKTFSMGEADHKRFYLEARRIV